ncbi:hypothetical protein BOX15_Mlig008536g1 [Macrostomum lignano]|uniref:Uncharacterized protein n=1 Tax=Macrostomum lignano TaxID=282301 RepID=A0A267DBZ3_9PLAT|nr:hypothetical protein BOX15_Mlig008536g1 [Macrostomum lignano]
MSRLSNSVCIRVFLALFFSFVVYYNEKHIVFGDDLTESSIFTGKYTMLTNLNIIFLCGCLVFSVICCLLDNRNILHKFNAVLAGTSSAVSLLVFVLFWTLFLINRELVYPTELDEYIPVWHNHALHTAILPVSLVNYCLLPSRDSPRLWVLLLTSMSLGLAYIAWVHVIHSVTGWWVYPILEVLTPSQRLLFIAGCAGSVVPFTCAVYAVKSRSDQRCCPKSGDKPIGRSVEAKGDYKKM